MATDMVEIRWHARGGQGSKTAATMMAHVALDEGKFGQGFPDYGPEREGAPMRAYTRLSSRPIRIHSAVYTPDVVIVLDPTLLETVPVTEGLREDGVLLVNTPLSPAEIRERTGFKTGRVFTVNASQISIDEIGRNIPNTPMLGALLKARPLLKVESVKSDVAHKLKSKGDRVVQGNQRAIQRAYEEVREG